MIGLFFGSFNPIHNGHLEIARYLVSKRICDEVWFVISPQNPFKKKEDLADEAIRLSWVNQVIQDEINLRSCDIEFSLPQPSYTIDTIDVLREKHPEQEFAIIMGGDNIINIQKWKEWERLVQLCTIIVYPRPGQERIKYDFGKIIWVDAPLMDISSTQIRQAVIEDKAIEGIIPITIVNDVRRYFK